MSRLQGPPSGNDGASDNGSDPKAREAKRTEQQRLRHQFHNQYTPPRWHAPAWMVWLIVSAGALTAMYRLYATSWLGWAAAILGVLISAVMIVILRLEERHREESAFGIEHNFNDAIGITVDYETTPTASALRLFRLIMAVLVGALIWVGIAAVIMAVIFG